MLATAAVAHRTRGHTYFTFYFISTDGRQLYKGIWSRKEPNRRQHDYVAPQENEENTVRIYYSMQCVWGRCVVCTNIGLLETFVRVSV